MLDPQRDTGVCGDLLLLGLVNLLQTIIKSFYFYCCSSPLSIICAYFCCHIFSSIYIIGFCNLMNKTYQKKITLQPKCNHSHRYQKDRWKYHPQGINRTIQVRGWRCRRDKARRRNFWERYNITIRKDTRNDSKQTSWASEYQW